MRFSQSGRRRSLRDRHSRYNRPWPDLTGGQRITEKLARGSRGAGRYNRHMDAHPPYDPRYLAGIVLFNRGDFFEAHEAWEALWMDTAGPDKRFYQGLIQAAVGLCHFCNGNVRGAAKLYHSSRDYMSRYGQR